MSLLFKGISESFGGYSLTDQLLLNLKLWINNGLLYHGGFEAVRLNTSTLFSNDESILKPEFKENYMDYCVWAGIGKEWVWESGIVISNPPFRVSGVYVNGSFHPSTETGLYAHHIDYLNGQIIFDNPQSASDIIQAEYCYRSVNVDNVDSDNFRELLQNSIKSFDQDIRPSGQLDRARQIWLPAIFIDISRGSQRGLELGGGQIKEKDINLFIFADKISDRNLLLDWLDFQSRRSFTIADFNSAPTLFDEYGTVSPYIQNLQQLTDTYPYKKLRLMDGTVSRIDSINRNIFRGRVTWKAEIDMCCI